MGRPRKYPVHVLATGETVLIPYNTDKKGWRLDCQDTIYASVRQEEKRFGKKFRADPLPGGVRVTRLM